MNLKAVLFDLDGTLTDTLGDLTISVNHALEKCGFPARSAEEVRSFVGNGVRKLIYRSVPADTPEAVAENCLDIFKEYYKNNSLVETKPYDGVVELLAELKNRGVKVAVVTNKMHTAAVDIVDHFFGNLVDFTVGQIDGVAQKPQPDGIYLALEKLCVSRQSAVYAGDSEVDCITARNAGIPCIGVTWGFRDRDVLEAHGADFIADKAEEILGIVSKF